MIERRNKGDGWDGLYNFLTQMNPGDGRRMQEPRPLKVLVRFPDGDREVPASVSCDDDGDFRDIRRSPVSRAVPEPMAGWEFDEVIGYPSWYARRA